MIYDLNKDYKLLVEQKLEQIISIIELFNKFYFLRKV
jgi:hypothetical protein